MKRGLTLIELVVLLSVAGIAGALLVPALRDSRSVCLGPPPCPTNLMMLFTAVRLYADDHDAVLPPMAAADVASSVEPFARPFGWADAIHSYVRSPSTWQCPDQGTAGGADATRSNFTDYWLNANLAGRSLAGLRGKTFLLGEGNDGRERTNARYALQHLAPSWAGPASPARRHSGGFYSIAFDGHVSWLLGEAAERYNIFFSPRRGQRKYLRSGRALKWLRRAERED